MAEIQEGEINDIRDQDEFTLPEESSNPGVDETEDCEIVKDEVRAHIRGVGDPLSIG